jgi:antirestriction protein
LAECHHCEGREAKVIEAWPSGEEWMIADTEGFDGNIKEYSPLSLVVELAEILEDLGEEADAYLAWWSNQGGDMPSQSDFEDALVDKAESFKDWAEEFADEYLLDNENIPQEVKQYFDYEAYARDLEHVYTVLDLPDGNKAIFRD